MTTFSILDVLDKDEEKKYEMWSTYVLYFEDKMRRLNYSDTLMTYFEWLDHFGLS